MLTDIVFFHKLLQMKQHEEISKKFQNFAIILKFTYSAMENQIRRIFSKRTEK